MNFQLSTLELAHVLKCEKDTFNKDFILNEVVYDTRKIINGKGVVFLPYRENIGMERRLSTRHTKKEFVYLFCVNCRTKLMMMPFI